MKTAAATPSHSAAPAPGWADYDPVDGPAGAAGKPFRGRRVLRRPGESDAGWRTRRRRAIGFWLAEEGPVVADKLALVLTEQDAWRGCAVAHCRRSRACLGRRPAGAWVGVWRSDEVPLCRGGAAAIDRLMREISARDRRAIDFLYRPDGE